MMTVARGWLPPPHSRYRPHPLQLAALTALLTESLCAVTAVSETGLYPHHMIDPLAADLAGVLAELPAPVLS